MLVLLLLLLPLAYACRSLHSKSHGLELACCSRSAPLPPNCEFSPLCEGDCVCRLLLSAELNCGNGTNHEWMDHSAARGQLSCLQPKLPNSGTPYHVAVQEWSQNYTSSFLRGLCGSNVTKMTIGVDRIEGELPDFGRCFPFLESFEIALKYKQPLELGRILSGVSRLYSLKTTGVDFELPVKAPNWISSIEFLHIEHSELSELPKWMATAEKLSSLVVKHTRLSSVSTVTQLKSLRSLRLSHNRLDDLHRYAFSNPDLHDLDLSHNHIVHLASFTFTHSLNLRVLDLSYNPIKELPFRPFSKNSRVKWLKLSHTGITTLSADHFVGLVSLKTLTLTHSPLQSIAPFAFLPLKNLRSLDLQACNLTRIPVAVTHNCALTHLNLADNLLHRGSSLPPEVLALLSSLSQFRIEGNPLTEFSPALLLLSTDNARLYRQLVLTTTQLPLWTSEPCTPYYWHLHLRNKSLPLRQLVSPWNQEKMAKEDLIHCREQYDWMSEQMTIYRDLERSSGCSVSRRLRSSMERSTALQCPNVTDFFPPPTILPRPVRISPNLLLIVSLASNVVFVFLIMIIICLIWANGRREKY